MPCQGILKMSGGNLVTLPDKQGAYGCVPVKRPGQATPDP